MTKNALINEEVFLIQSVSFCGIKTCMLLCRKNFDVKCFLNLMSLKFKSCSHKKPPEVHYLFPGGFEQKHEKSLHKLLFEEFALRFILSHNVLLQYAEAMQIIDWLQEEKLFAD